ncbi:MAG: hypothetical protein ACLFSG_07590, partial [Halothiobacillaceae bacterium]
MTGFSGMGVLGVHWHVPFCCMTVEVVTAGPECIGRLGQAGGEHDCGAVVPRPGAQNDWSAAGDRSLQEVACVRLWLLALGKVCTNRLRGRKMAETA